jgi:hypothetical protein
MWHSEGAFARERVWLRTRAPQFACAVYMRLRSHRGCPLGPAERGAACRGRGRLRANVSGCGRAPRFDCVVYMWLRTHRGWPLGPAERGARLQRTMGGESGRVARGSVGGASVLGAIISPSARSLCAVGPAGSSSPAVIGSGSWEVSLAWLEGGGVVDAIICSATPIARRPVRVRRASRSPSQLPAGTVPERCGARRTYCTAPLPSSGGDAGAAGRRVGASGGERRARGPASTYAEISVPAALPSPRLPFSSPPACFAPDLRSRTSLRPLSCSLSRNPNPRVARF